MTIFIGRETKPTFLPTKINEKSVRSAPLTIMIHLEKLTIQRLSLLTAFASDRHVVAVSGLRVEGGHFSLLFVQHFLGLLL